MAAFTSKTSGNWSAGGQTTWNEVGVPGNGDTVTIQNGHTVTVDANTIIGTSGVNGTAAITTAGTGKVVIAALKQLTIRGDFVVPGLQPSIQATVTNNSGIWEWDSSLAASPATTKYCMRTAGGQYGGANYMVCNGTALARCTVRSNAGGGNGYFSTATDTGGGYLYARYTDFLRIGDSVKDGFQPDFPVGNNPPDGPWDLDHCSFDGCGLLDAPNIQAFTIFRHKHCKHINSAGSSTQLASSQAALTTGVREIEFNTFDKDWGASSFVRDFTIDDNVFENGYSVSTTYAPASCDRNLGRQLAGSGTAVAGSIRDSYLLYDAYADLTHHIDVTASLDLEGNVIDGTFAAINSSDVSDGLIVPAGNSGVYNIRNNIVLPAGDGRGCSALCAPRQDSTATINVEHNTVSVGKMAIEIVQVGAGVSASTIKNNIFWDTAVRGMILDASGAATPTLDYFSPSNIAKNCQRNILQTATPGTGFTNQGNGYGSKFSSTPGTTDIVADPRFVDATRNFVTFDSAYLGHVAGSEWASHSSADTFAVGDIVSHRSASYYNAATINYRCIQSHLKSTANSEPGVGSAFHTYWEFASLSTIRDAVYAGSTITDTTIGAAADSYITALLKWVRAGFAPQNSVLSLAGTDGLDIGAVDFFAAVALPPIVVSPSSLLPGESDSNPSSTMVVRSTIVSHLLGPLHAAATADLVMWYECELIQWIDAAVKKLARKAGLFVGRSIGTTVSGTATHSLPSQHISTIHVSYDSTPLRAASTGEIAARDSAWQTAQDTPKRWYQDSLGMSTIGLHPVPDDALALWIIYHGWPTTVDCAGANQNIPMPQALEPYIELETVAEAYSKEGDGYAPDIAKAARQLSGLYEQVALEYWGPVG